MFDWIKNIFSHKYDNVDVDSDKNNSDHKKVVDMKKEEVVVEPLSESKEKEDNQ
ncbi:hypothetical protein [Photobacterium sp. R1]